MAHVLGAEKLHLEYPTKVIFEQVTLGVSEGDRIGIVGANGEGKTSLLQILAGAKEPDAGRVTRRTDIKLGFLDQGDVLDPEQSVVEVVVGQGPDYEWASNSRIRQIIGGLLSNIEWDARIGDLSGGQRRRVALAQLLVGDYDVLALDEPTNHLDVEAITWLAEHIKKRWSAHAGALLVITHDRWFLDEVCTRTWEVHEKKIDSFEGGYAAYILQRAERQKQIQAIEARRQNLVRKELAWLRRGAPARTSKPKFRIEAANVLIENEPEIRNKVSLQTLSASRMGKDVVDLLEVQKEYDGEVVLSEVNWRIAPGERAGILGPNGAGKSTLLALISGRTEPTVGEVKLGKTVRIAALTQDLDDLEIYAQDPVRVVVSRLRATYTIGVGTKARELTPGQLLERLGFESAHLSTAVQDLSGGQKRRLQLLLILLQQPNFLILDEPTNDLDTDMLAALEDVLDSWTGVLLVVSHDRYFLERVTDNQYGIFQGRFRHLPGGIDEYLHCLKECQPGQYLAQEDAQAHSLKALDVDESMAEQVAVVDKLSGAEAHRVKKEITSIERRLVKLNAQLREGELELAELDQSDYLQVQQKANDVDEIRSEIRLREEGWLALSELFEERE